MAKSIFLACLVCLVATANGAAQGVAVERRAYRYPNRLHWSAYDPYYAVTSRIYAQADLIRAQGDAAVDYAYARNLHADAYGKELDNWVKELRVYWDRKIVAEQKKLELDHVRQISRMKYLNDHRWQNSRLWDRLKNHPELSSAHIRNGDALNFMLARLAASTLPYKFDAKSSRFSAQALEQLELDDQILSQLSLKQGQLTFQANETVGGSINLWPYILRWKDFDKARTAFEEARVAAVKESAADGQVSVDSIQRLQNSLIALTSQFHRSQKVAQWVKLKHRFTHFYSGDRFLQELDREIVQLEKTGDIRPFRGKIVFDPNEDSEHVVSLLCFMNRNGVEFGPAKPGSEFAYHQLFVMTRALYLTVAEEDESIQPANLGKLAK